MSRPGDMTGPNVTGIKRERYDELLHTRDFEKTFTAPIDQRHAYRAAGRRLFAPDGTYGIVLRFDTRPCQEKPDQHSIAVKLYFHRPLPDVIRRYEAICAHLDSLADPLHLLLQPTLHKTSLVLDGVTVPVVTMPWVDGNRLDVHLDNSYRDEPKKVPSRLMAAEFLLGMIELEQAGISLGDICPPNIMVEPSGRMRLVDYDNMYVPALRGAERFSDASVLLIAPALATAQFDEAADNGATLRLFTELFSLSPARWAKYGSADWLLRLEDQALLDDIKGTRDTRELMELYQSVVGAPTPRHLSPSELLERCSSVKHALRRIIEGSERDDLKLLWKRCSRVGPPSVRPALPALRPRPRTVPPRPPPGAAAPAVAAVAPVAPPPPPFRLISTPAPPSLPPLPAVLPVASIPPASTPLAPRPTAAPPPPPAPAGGQQSWFETAYPYVQGGLVGAGGCFGVLWLIATLGVCTRPKPAAIAASAGETTRCPHDMVLIRTGTFKMGSPPGQGQDDEHPKPHGDRTVTVSAYCIDRTEVTMGAYNACVANGACTANATEAGCNGADRPDHPVNCVGWDQAASYCRAVDRALPTEAQWEFAAGGTGGREFPWGDEPPAVARLNAGEQNDGYLNTAPVGSFPAGATPLGVMDLAGNVSEWVADEFVEYRAGTITDPPAQNASGHTATLRGGGWHATEPRWFRSADRHGTKRDGQFSDLGFRCVRRPIHD